MLIEPRPWVICEWHADFVSAGPDGAQSHCLVSVKHRSLDQGPWPLADLPKRGGFKVLYERWLASGRWHTCRWVTNAGLKPGELQARELANLLAAPSSAEREQRLMQFATLLSDGIGGDPPDIVSFLESLQIFTTGGDEFSIRAQVIDNTARPVMQRLGVAPGLARTAYMAAYDLVVEAVLNLDPDEPNVTWMSGADLDEADRVKRTISRKRLLEKLYERGIAIPEDAVAVTATVSNMIRKLQAGDLGPTVVAAAPRLRRRWYQLEALYRSDMPSPLQDELDRIRAEVLHRAIIAESRTRRPGEAYGTAMHNELTNLLSQDDIKPRILGASTPEFVGCAYQLTDECDVWWSDEFDPRQAAPWLSGSGWSGPYAQREHSSLETEVDSGEVAA